MVCTRIFNWPFFLHFQEDANNYIHATRYRDKTHGQKELDWQYTPVTPLEGRTVLLIDDILDEGLTLSVVRDYCVAQNTKAVFTAVLADKQRPRALLAQC